MDIVENEKRIDSIMLECKKLDAECSSLAQQLNASNERNGRLRVLLEISDRIETLAVKWIDSGHHDWLEIKKLIMAKDEVRRSLQDRD